LPDGDGRFVDRVPSALPAPDRVSTGRLFGRDLTRAMNRLPPTPRAAILLRHQQGLSYPEISKALDIPVNTAKTMVHRGLLRLRAELAAWSATESNDGD
jgi:RNA polymerase sigma factor (sigma-70 family)